MNDTGVDAPLGQALCVIFAFSGHALTVALNVAAMCADVGALAILKSMFAPLHMASRALLHLLRIMAGIVHILMAELAFHGSLLAG
ncbi:MAG TPA: hypothetical protein VEZ24_02985 [Microvirga sp.]|nr:hypothetical protein [Microvirga sp.]